MSKTVVVNFFAGPGARKSTMAMDVCAELKWAGINCEFTGEEAKDKVWENSTAVLDNQIYIFGKQHLRIWRLAGKVDIVTCDSPLLLSMIYDRNKSAAFRALILEEYNRYENINFFVMRKAAFNPSGRIHDEAGSKQIDQEVLRMLQDNRIPYMTVLGEQEKVPKVTRMVIDFAKSCGKLRTQEETCHPS